MLEIIGSYNSNLLKANVVNMHHANLSYLSKSKSRLEHQMQCVCNQIKAQFARLTMLEMATHERTGIGTPQPIIIRKVHSNTFLLAVHLKEYECSHSHSVYIHYNNL